MPDRAHEPSPSSHSHQSTEVEGSAIAVALDNAITDVEKHEYLWPLFNNSSNVIVALDTHYRVIDFNPSAVEKLGWQRETTLGRHCSDVLRCKNLNGLVLCGTSSCPLTHVLQQKKPIPNEELICGTLPDLIAEYAVGVTPIEIEKGTVVVFSARDVKLSKATNSARANFVSMVSHELRTPLNSVHGFIDLLIQGHMGELNPEQKTYLGYAQEGVQQLMRIVEDILFLTRSDSGQFEMRMEKVNLLSLAKQVLRGLQPQAEKASIVLNRDIFSPSPLLYADPQRIMQVLNNLLVNAIKFTPPGGSVTLRARPYDEHFVLISVQDTGYGIAPEDRAHIFERFYQANHHLQSRMGGNGLGLSIAKLIVEQHGGQINFESAVNEGTTFYFTVPLYIESPPQRGL